MDTMTSFRPLTVLGAIPGALLGAASAVTARLRRDKPLHPVGHVATGRLTILRPQPDLGVPALAGPGTVACVARWSRAMGLPPGWPDLEGLALRLHGAGADGGDGDLLFASTGTRAWSRFLLTLRPPGTFGPVTTLLPVRAGDRAVTFRLAPAGDPSPSDDGMPPAAYDLAVARGTGAWLTVGRVDLQWSLDDTTERFDPITHELAGIEQFPVVTGLREPAYVAARAVARARPTTEKRSHA